MRRRPFLMRSCGGSVGDVLAEEMDPPGGGREVAGDGVEQRRLAGAVRAEDGVLLAGGDAQRDVVDGAQGAECARHAAQHQRVVRGQRRARRRRAAPRPGRRWRAGRAKLGDRCHRPRRLPLRGRPARRASPSGTLPSSCRAAGRRCRPCCTTLLKRLPWASFTTSVTKVVPIAWRLASSRTSPFGVFSTIFESASRYFAWLPDRSPLTASRPSSAAFMFIVVHVGEQARAREAAGRDRDSSSGSRRRRPSTRRRRTSRRPGRPTACRPASRAACRGS